MSKPRSTSRPWLPLVGSAFAIAFAFFLLPSVLAFDLKGGESAVRHWADALSLIRLAPTLGGVETIALVPAVSSHIRLTSEERHAAGISDGMIRISCGIEAADDIIADLDRALVRQP